MNIIFSLTCIHLSNDLFIHIHIHLLFLSSFRFQWINMHSLQVVEGTREGQGREEDCGRHIRLSATWWDNINDGWWLWWEGWGLYYLVRGIKFMYWWLLYWQLIESSWIPMVVAMYMEARATERQYLHAAIYDIGRAVGFCLESDSFCVVLIW